MTLKKENTEPEAAITFQPSATVFNMWLELTGKGTITLDWGQGDVDIMDFDVDPENATATAFRVRDQSYSTSIPPAKITGDVHLVVGLNFEAAVSALNTESAPALALLAFLHADIPVLNLSTNHALTMLTFDNSTIGELILPEQHKITYLSIAPSAFWPGTEQVDYIVSNIYLNTVAETLNNGTLALSNSPVSEESGIMLQDLENTYGWLITH